ncbi:MAG: isoprenyl transferase [Clostridiales bacterium]|nr:isoprenyl transferase [Clostridiales bacterium]
MDLPRHIAVIMDGNGRWAKKRFLPRMVGHRTGSENLKKLINDCDDLGLEHITFYAFSTENWKRSQEEVSNLMDLLREYLDDHIKNEKDNNFRIDFIGDMSKLAPDIQEKMNIVRKLYSTHKGIFVHIAMNYGSRDEIRRAVTELAKDVKAGHLQPEDITEELISYHLDTRNIPDPELLIRTSGEMRLSNFLMWQLAYSEFYFSDKFWPDFKINDLLEAVKSYNSRDRRFGGRNEVK